MNPILALIAARIWAAEPSALNAWACGKEGMGALVQAGMSPVERANRALRGESVVVPAIVGDVATIDVQGVLMLNGPWWAKMDGDATDYLDIRAALDQVAANAAVREVVLAIDSPGGDAIGLAETVLAIERVQAAGKTVRAH